jgi:hypothetical protein
MTAYQKLEVNEKEGGWIGVSLETCARDVCISWQVRCEIMSESPTETSDLQGGGTSRLRFKHEQCCTPDCEGVLVLEMQSYIRDTVCNGCHCTAQHVVTPAYGYAFPYYFLSLSSTRSANPFSFPGSWSLAGNLAVILTWKSALRLSVCACVRGTVCVCVRERERERRGDVSLNRLMFSLGRQSFMHARLMRINCATVWLSQQGFCCSRALVDDIVLCYDE